MSTGTEIQLRMAEAERHWLIPLHERLGVVVKDIAVALLGRKVCARRARKLRKRGHRVVRSVVSPRGKQRYAWIPPGFVIRATL